MASIRAKKVAEEVLETIGRGKMPSVNKIAPRNGYPKTTARSGNIQKTKTFQRVIAENKKPLIERLTIERDRALDGMNKKIAKAKYRDLSDAVEKYTKLIQLLTGEATENIAHSIKKLNDAELEHLAGRRK